MFDAQKVTKDVIKWIRDYFDATASPTTPCVIGISGGKDSSIVAALCAEALGKDRVIGVMMPSGVQSVSSSPTFIRRERAICAASSPEIV